MSAANLLVAALNHLLGQAHWARARLTPFAGRRVRIESPLLALSLIVTAAGDFVPADEDSPADVTLRLPADLPGLLLQGPEKLIARAHVEGNAEFATALSFVFQHLSWDVEEDLSRLIGDIAAHRLLMTAKRCLAWQRDAVARGCENLAEFLRDEARLLVPRPEQALFADELARLMDALTALEQRLERLTRSG